MTTEAPPPDMITQIRQRLLIGSAYDVADMRADIVFMLRAYDHLNAIITKAVEDPQTAVAIDAAAVGILQRSLRSSEAMVTLMKSKNDILEKELLNLHRWMRERADLRDDMLKVMRSKTPEELAQICKQEPH